MGSIFKNLRRLICIFSLQCMLDPGLCFSANPKKAPSFSYEIIESQDLGDCGIAALIKIKTSGLATNTAVALTSTGLDDNSVLISDNLFVGNRGYLHNCAEPETPFQVGLYGLSRGEPLTLKIYKRKEFLKKRNSRKYSPRPLATIPIVPFPIEAIDKHNRRVSIVVASPDAKHFIFQGENFRPLEDVLITSKSGKETINSKIKVTEEGSFVGLLSPSIQEEASGCASLSFQDNEAEIMILQYKWGIAN